MLKFITDPHLGRNAVSHTTASSRALLNVRIQQTLSTQLDNADCPTVLAGDLFHKAHNSEETIAAGMAAALRCDIVLAGNHDLTNRANSESSLQLLAKVPELKNTIVIADIGATLVRSETLGGVDITFIPHHTHQDLFDSAVAYAVANCEGHIVCLHCNVECGYAESNNAALNLNKDQIEALLNKFDYVVVGHEHNHRWGYNGHLLVLGNLHPTSFSDISDKFSWTYDPEANQWHSECTWKSSQRYLSITAQDFMTYGLALTGREFVEITGELATTGQVRALADAMRVAWQDAYDNGKPLMMLKNATEVKGVNLNTAQQQGGHSENLIDVINQAVKGTEIEGVWTIYRDDYNAKATGNN